MKNNGRIRNIWCCRIEEQFFAISRIEGESWYIILFGYEFWIGPNKPSFIGTVRKR